MARKPIQIDVASDTRQFSKGVQSGVIAPLEDVYQALEDVARESQFSGDTLVDSVKEARRAVEDVGDGFKDLERTSEQSMREAQLDTEDLSHKHKALQDLIDNGSRDSFRTMKTESRQATRSAVGDVDEFKSEAKQNFSEVASSFTGDMDSAVDLVQGSLGGLAGSIPGYGIALGGLGAAAGLFYTQWKEKTEATKQRVSEMYEDMLSSGLDYLSKDFIVQRMTDIQNGVEGVGASIKDVETTAKELGVSEEEVLLAFAGHADTRNRLLDVAREKYDQNSESVAGLGDVETEAMLNSQDAARDAINLLESFADEQGRATDKVDTTRSAIDRLDQAQGLKNAVDQAERFGTKLGDASNRMTEFPSAKTVTITPELNTASFNDAWARLKNTPRRITVDAEIVSRYGRSVR